MATFNTSDFQPAGVNNKASAYKGVGRYRHELRASVHVPENVSHLLKTNPDKNRVLVLAKGDNPEKLAWIRHQFLEEVKSRGWEAMIEEAKFFPYEWHPATLPPTFV